ALSLRVATGQKIRFAGTGEKPQDLEVFLADRMASRILGMGDVLTLIEKAERTIDQDQAKEVEKHLRAGQLSFDDFLAQIRQVRGMGSLEGMLDMVPGGGALKGQLAAAGRAQGAPAGGAQGAPAVDPEREMKRMEAIILSMTPQERARPDLIDGRRKRRIARGSGVQPADVNRLFKARETMQKLARQFGKQRGGSQLAGRYGQGGAGW
ncbi:MAG TPA: signal recognition particle protein, partial [Dongiaceae bacterium]